MIAGGLHPGNALSRIAAHEGFFAAEGIEAVLQMYPSGKAGLDAVFADQADLAFPAETPIVLATLEGKRPAIVAVVERSSRSNAIVARKDHGIAGPADLRGKSIAALQGTNTHFFLDSYLQAHGIAGAEVKFQFLKPTELVAALTNGEIDAASVFSPYIQQMQQALGDRALLLTDDRIYTESISLVGTRLVRERPRTIVKVLRALLKAEIFARQNREAAQRIVAEYTGMGLPLTAEVWDNYDFSLQLGQGLLLSLEDQARWAIDRRLTPATKVPNFLDVISPDGLQAVKPEAVKIFR